MADEIANKGSAGAPASAVPAAGTVTTGTEGSPWEDDVDVPAIETIKKPMVIGSLDDEPLESSSAKPFVVPDGVEEKVGQKIPAAQFIPPVQSPVVEAAANSASVSKKIDTIQLATLPVAAAAVTPQTKLQSPAVVPVGQPEEQVADAIVDQKPRLSLAKLLPGGGSRGLMIGLAGFLGVVVLLIFSVFLTERGIVSFGLEKVYGAIGIEKIWGGLSANPQIALMQSAANIQSHPNFKVKGTIAITVDKSIKSKITSPLVALAEPTKPVTSGDDTRGISIKLAVADSSAGTDTLDGATTDNSAIDPGTDSSVSSSTDGLSPSSSTNPVTTSPYDSVSGSSASPSATGSSTQSQSDSQGYQYQSASIKEIPADVSANFSSSGAESVMKINKITGTENLSLKTKDGKLWLQSSSGIKYSTNAKPDKWLEYNLKSGTSNQVQKDFFSYNAGSGFSVRGSRLATEKVSGVESFRYKIDSLEIGNSLSSLGITSGMVQNVTGDAWIGVRDKLVRKIALKITTASTVSVSLIDVSLEFSDYDILNEISAPAANSIIKDTGSSVAATGDAKRKVDLASIRDALEIYKVDKGSYPLAKDTVRLDDPSGTVFKVLDPDYLVAIPTDPKASEKWFYGYKSDGSTYTLSARLESTTDKEGVATGGIYLYFVYNK